MAARTVFITGATGYLGSALVPFCALLELLPGTREAARRLGLVTRAQMTRALAAAVEIRHDGVRILEVPAIRAA